MVNEVNRGICEGSGFIDPKNIPKASNFWKYFAVIGGIIFLVVGLGIGNYIAPDRYDEGYDLGYDEGTEDGYDLGYDEGLTDGDPSFQLNISFADFYIQDVDTLEKNYSYYLHGFQVNGIRFRQEDWDICKNMNSTEWSIYAQSNIYFVEQSLWGIIDSSMNKSVSVDNSEFITYHLPIVIIADYTLNIYNDDETYFDEEVVFSSLFFDYMLNTTSIFDQYLYKETESGGIMSIKILGCSYNFTSNAFDRMFIEFNGVPREVLAP